MILYVIISIAIVFGLNRKFYYDRSIRILKEDLFLLKEENKSLKIQLSLPPERRCLDIQTYRTSGPIEIGYNKHRRELEILIAQLTMIGTVAQFLSERINPLKRK